MLLVIVELSFVDGCSCNFLATTLPHVILIGSLISPSFSIRIDSSAIPQSSINLSSVFIDARALRIDHSCLFKCIIFPLAAVSDTFLCLVVSLAVAPVGQPLSLILVSVFEVFSMACFLALSPVPLIKLQRLITINIDSLSIFDSIEPMSIVNDDGRILINCKCAVSMVFPIEELTVVGSFATGVSVISNA